MEDLLQEENTGTVWTIKGNLRRALKCYWITFFEAQRDPDHVSIYINISKL